MESIMKKIKIKKKIIDAIGGHDKAALALTSYAATVGSSYHVGGTAGDNSTSLTCVVKTDTSGADDISRPSTERISERTR